MWINHRILLEKMLIVPTLTLAIGDGLLICGIDGKWNEWTSLIAGIPRRDSIFERVKVVNKINVRVVINSI